MYATEQASGPGIGLVVLGVLNILYGAVNATWSLVSLGVGGAVLIDSFSSASATPALQVVMVVQALVPALQIGAYFVIGLMGVVMVGGGVRLRQVRSRALVWMATVSAFAAPLLGLLAAVGSLGGAGGCCCLGVGIGGVLTIPTGLLGLVVGTWCFSVLSDPQVRDAFDRP